MSTEVQLMTADELLAMPDDGIRYELVRGELIKMTPPPGHEHGLVTMNLAGHLFEFVKANQLGKVLAAETGFRIEQNPDTVQAPDVAFIRRERIEKKGKIQGYWPGAPDLAVEVISPSDTVSRIEGKVSEWLTAGSKQVWVVSSKLRTITIYSSLTDITTLTEKDRLSGGEIVPGFELAVAEIFGE
jgi:Uma2 family endonuclease